MRAKPKDRRLYWRGDKLWCRVVGLNGRTVRRATGCTDVAAATRVADRFELESADPAYAAAQAATIGGAMITYFADLDRRKRSAATKLIARQKCGHFARIWGEDMPLSRVTAPLVLEYIDKRQGERVVDYTIRKELSQLRQALQIARHMGLFPTELDRVFPPFFGGTYKARERWPTPEEIARLEGCLRADRFGLVLLILGTGCRMSEARAMGRHHIDLSRGLVHIGGTKTAMSKASIPITAVSRPLLERALSLATGDAPLFDRWTNVRRDLIDACERAKISTLTPNDLRRGFAQWHKRSGVSNELTSKLLRHSTTELVERTYGNLDASGFGPLIASDLAKSAVLITYRGRAATAATRTTEDDKTMVNSCVTVDSNHWPTAPEAASRVLRSIGGNRSESPKGSRTVPNLYPRPWVLEATANLLSLRVAALEGAS